MVALVVTSLLRQRLGVRAWKAIHWSAYALFPFAVLHALGAGSDVGFTWMRAVLIGCSVAVVGAIGWRTSETFAEKSRVRRRPQLPPRARTRMETVR
jgi:sulfoxide reductase heme-binding subunit YedZ